MPPSDAVLAHITFDPGSRLDELAPIPWPAGSAPTPVALPARATDDPLATADVLIVTYTTAEARALADVLTPGVVSSSWSHYTRDWVSYEGQLGERSPALESKRLGSWCCTRIGNRTAVCFKSELHPATDGPDLPMVRLWRQVVGDVRPRLVITTGTAGGVGQDTQLGDVAVATTVRWDCREQFKSEPWATTGYPTAPLTEAMRAALDGTTGLLAANAEKVPPAYRTRPVRIWTADTTLTTDFFAIGDSVDHYGLLRLAADCRAVEMDDAALGLAFSQLTSPPPFLSIRNASDPVMPGQDPLNQQIKEAGSIYQRYGYFTTVSSAIACWAVVTAL
jgi:nucleoside phosphorylase